MTRTLVTALALALAGSTGAGPLSGPPKLTIPKPRQAEVFVTAMHAKDPKTRRIALERLAEVADEPAAQQAAKAIAATALDGKEPAEVRQAALWALVAMPKVAAIDELWPLVKKPQRDRITGIAAIALAKHGSSPEMLAQFLLVLVRMPDDFTREACAEALGLLGDRVLPTLRARLATASGVELDGILRALATMKAAAAPALPELRAALAAAKRDYDRDELREIIARIEGKPSLDAALDALAHKPTKLALYGIAHELEGLGPAGHAALPPLLAQLSTDTAGLVLDTAAKIAAPADRAALAKAAAPYLAATDSYVLHATVGALVASGPDGRAALERALASGTVDARVAILQAEAQLGWPFATVEPLARASDPRVRAAALDALGTYGTRAEAALVAGLGDGNESVRASAAGGLGHVPTPGAVTALARALGDRESYVREAAARSIGALGPVAASAAPALLAAGAKVQVTSAEHELAKLGPSIVPVLRKALADRDDRTRRTALDALGALGRAADAAVPEIVALVASDPSNYARADAARALGAIGSAAAKAVPDLESALLDPDSFVRESAARALGQIGGPSPAGRRFLIELVERGDIAAGDALATLVARGPAPDLVPALRALIATKSSTSTARGDAIRALVAANDRSAATLRALRDAMAHDESAYVRAPAAEALLALGGEPDIVPALAVLDGADDAKRAEDTKAIQELNEMMQGP